MHIPASKEFVGALIFGVELAIAGIIGGFILGMLPDEYKAKAMKYQWFALAIVFIVLGMFIMPKLFMQIGMTFLAIGVMMLVLQHVNI